MPDPAIIKKLASKLASLRRVRDHVMELEGRKTLMMSEFNDLSNEINLLEDDLTDVKKEVLLERFLELNRQIKVLDFEIDILEKKLPDLVKTEKALESTIFKSHQNKRRTSTSHEMEEVNLIRKKQEIIAEIEDSIKVNKKVYGILASMNAVIDQGAAFDKIGDSYRETQALKKIVNQHLALCKQMVTSVDLEIETLIQELQDVKDLIGSHNDPSTLRIIIFNYTEIDEIVNQIGFEKLLYGVGEKVNKLLDLLSHLLRSLRKKKHSLKHEIISLKEDLIKNHKNLPPLEDL